MSEATTQSDAESRPPVMERRLGAAIDGVDVILSALCLLVLWKAPSFVVLFMPVALVCFGLERVIPFRRQPVLRPAWRTDLYHGFLSLAVATLVTVAIIGLVGPPLHAMVVARLPIVGAQPTWLLVIEAVLLGDLGFYLQHRLNHAVPLLWRFHAVHHSAEYLDFLATNRTHPVDQVLKDIAGLLPLYIIGVPGWCLIALAISQRTVATVAHSNLRFGLGKLWWVIRTPEYHRWHHAKERRAANSNYADFFPIWDVLFRTVYLPRDREPKAFGIPQPMPQAYLDQILEPFMPSGQSDAA